MTDTTDDGPIDPERRGFLEKATGIVAGTGIAAASWPFIQSMNPSRDVASHATTDVSLAGIAPGEAKTVSWQGKPVFILHRTPQEIAAARASDGSDKDPAADATRVQKPQWLVVVGICTHLGCVPSRTQQGWFCPCHGSVYDNSGRILRGPAPRNLDVPPYHFAGTDDIVIGKG